MTTWYRHGSASVENGSRAVTGTITGWLNQAKPGDGITFDAGATWYEVAQVESNTALTLATDYAGTTIVEGAYAIDRRSPRWTDTGTATMLMLQMLSQKTALMTTSGRPDNTVGADGSLAFDPDAQVFYFKVNGDWGDAVSLRGDGGWGPVFAIASDNARRVIQIVDWVGGTGDKPAAGLYVGDDGLVEDIADAVDVRGPQGAQGNAGWSAVTAIENDGERRVKRVVDWVGGAGSKPATGKYIGPAGYVDTPAEASDVRGPAGDGDLSGPGATVADGEIVVFDGTTGSAVKGSGFTINVPLAAINFKYPSEASPSRIRPGPSNGHLILEADYLNTSAGSAVIFSADNTYRAWINASQFRPAADGGLSFGAAGSGWSNVFLSSGSFVDWGNGDAALTHSAGNLRLSTPFSIGAEVPDASAQLDVQSTDRGFLPPRMTAAQRDDIPAPAAGLLVYNTDDNLPNYFDGADWLAVGAGLIRQNSQSAAYTITATDSGYDVFHPASDNNPRTFTIPANSSVAFPVGTVISITNMINVVTIAIDTDTLTFLGSGATGSRTLAANGMAVARKVAPTQWVISGVNLT